MTDPAGAQISDPFDYVPPFADATASLAECAAAVERRAEQLARIADDRANHRAGADAQDWRRLARETREEAAKARVFADRVGLRATATQPDGATSEQDPPF